MEDHIARNMQKAIEDGPRLRTDYETRAVARGEDGVLMSGLGALGVGTMWCRGESHSPDKPKFAHAPYNPDKLDGFGENGYAVRGPRHRGWREMQQERLARKDDLT